MKRTPILVVILACSISLALGAALWAQVPANATAEKPNNRPNLQKWEHLALEHGGASVADSPELAQQIKALGNEGWELVDVEAIVDTGTTTKTIYFFKRPR